MGYASRKFLTGMRENMTLIWFGASKVFSTELLLISYTSYGTPKSLAASESAALICEPKSFTIGV